jgi:ABC-2 type transport system ATP-binding protein
MSLLTVDIHRAGYEEGTIIEHIQFTVKKGEMVGLIGPNGAGKSTTIKTILGMMKHFEGQITFQQDFKRYSYIPEHPVYYDELTLWEHLELAAALNLQQQQGVPERAKWLVEEFKLTDVLDETPGRFSKGMQQKLMICLALLIQPDLYIVDEPFIGLDPIAMKKLLTLLDQEKQRGAGILLCTHVLDTAERICDRFVLLQQGQVLADGPLNAIQQQTGLLSGSLLDCFYHMIEGK